MFFEVYDFLSAGLYQDKRSSLGNIRCFTT